VELSFDTVTLGLIWFVVFLFSTTCHEGAHALGAKLGGDITGAGQVTINPFPHIQREPLGMVAVPVISFILGGWMIGWASTPYDPHWAHRHPHRAARMALAGPVANVTVMLFGAAAIRIGLALGTFQAPSTVTFSRITEAADPSSIGSLLAIFFSVLFMLNLILGAFNLLPVPPLDGNVGITILMSEDGARNFLDWFRQPGFGMMGLVLAWILFGRIFAVIWTVALNVLYTGITTYGSI